MQGNGTGHIGGIVELGHQVNPAEAVHREVLNGVAKQLAIRHDVAHIVGRQQRRDEHADFLHGAGDPGGRDEITHAEGAEDLQKHAGGEVAKHAAPGRTNRHAGASQQGREAGGLDAEEPQNRHHQDHPQHRRKDVDQIADNRDIQAAVAQTFAQNAHRQLNQPAAGDP
jgi:hypothetical protein